MANLRVDTIAGLGQTFGPNFNGDLEFNSQNFIVLPKGSSNQQGVLRTTEDVIGVGGTYYDNLVLALPLNEATQFKDVSSQNQVSAAITAVSIASTVSKFYGSSAYFNGNNNRMLVYNEAGNNTTPSNSRNLSPGNNDFTMEAYIRFNTLPASNIRIFGNVNNGSFLTSSWQYLRFSDGTSRLWNGSAYTSTGADNFVIDTWYHIAVVRSGGVQTLYIDGTAQGTTVTYSNNLTYPNLDIGSRDDGAEALDGYMQDIRFYIGVAKYTANFTPPDRIAEIGVGFKSGALRYNTDSNLPELYDGNQWVELQVSNVGLGTGGDTEPGPRGIWVGGNNGASYNDIVYVNISSTGDAVDFGDTTAGSLLGTGAAASSTRALFGGGQTPSGETQNIDTITIASTGNATDFGGDLTTQREFLSALSNSTRAIFVAGRTGTSATTDVDYATIASTGVNAQDFGDLATALVYYPMTCASPTRGLLGAGKTPAVSTSMEFLTIATTGTIQDFGETASGHGGGQGCSNAVRGVFGGGYNPGICNLITYVTISTTGNGTNFGDLQFSSRALGACASPTRGLWGGGATPSAPNNTNSINYVNISTQGDAVDFGDLSGSNSGAMRNKAACSNAHGGL